MGNSIVQKISMSGAREKVGNLAQTNHYFVEMAGISDNLTNHFNKSYQGDFGDLSRFKDRLGYLCSEASLPSSSYATSEVKDNFMGITQEFAHTRIYTDLDLTFYVDAEYKVMRFFEGWMDYISGGGAVAAASSPSRNVYRRFNYPNDYKLSTLNLYKFERDYRYSLNYNFINAFPKSVSSLPVSYGSAEILKITVTFNYDRYIVKKDVFYSDNDLNDAVSNIWKNPIDLGIDTDFSQFQFNGQLFSQQPIQPFTFPIDSPIENLF